MYGLASGDRADLVEGRNDCFPRRRNSEPREPLSGGVGHATVLADHRDLLEAVATADLEVVRVVAGSDLERPRAELGIDVLVRDDRKPAADERQDCGLPDEPRVAIVMRAHRDGGIGQHRLRAHGCDGDRAVAGLERIVDLVEGVLHLAVLHLQVRDRRAGARVPVHHVVVAVDVALVEERHEHLVDRSHISLVHREALAFVVAGRPEALVLLDDRRAVALLPFPDASVELLAAELLA